MSPDLLSHRTIQIYQENCHFAGAIFHLTNSLKQDTAEHHRRGLRVFLRVSAFNLQNSVRSLNFNLTKWANLNPLTLPLWPSWPLISASDLTYQLWALVISSPFFSHYLKQFAVAHGHSCGLLMFSRSCQQWSTTAFARAPSWVISS